MADKFDEVLLPFLTLMRKELHANSRKGDRPGWLAMDANTALLEVYWHTAKLSAAVKNNDGPAIMEHSADVANMAMMVLDVCGGLAFVDADGVKAAPAPGGGWEPDAWAEYIAGVLVSYLSSDNATRESNRREEAIAGIIRRRIHWLMPTAGVSASDSQTSPGIPASSALASSASGESTSGQVHSGDAPASAPLAGGSATNINRQE